MYVLMCGVRGSTVFLHRNASAATRQPEPRGPGCRGSMDDDSTRSVGIHQLIERSEVVYGVRRPLRVGGGFARDRT